MKAKLLFLLTLPAFFSYAQTEETDSVGEAKIVEVLPEFPGGEKGLLEYLVSVQIPEPYLDSDLEFRETVKVRFVVDSLGYVGDAEIVESSEYELLNKTSLKHINSMPRWTPGMTDGKPVKVQYVVPLKFVLEQKRKKKRER